MIAPVADTHTALWYLYDDARLSLVAAIASIKLSSIEPPRREARSSSQPSPSPKIVYLIEKNRLPTASACTDLKISLDDPDHVFKEAHFTVEIVDAMCQVRRADVPDMPDRIVAAPAAYFGVPVISRDGKIRASNVKTIW